MRKHTWRHALLCCLIVSLPSSLVVRAHKPSTGFIPAATGDVAAMGVETSLPNLTALPCGKKPIGPGDYLAFKYDCNKNELALKIGEAFFRQEIEKLPEQKLRNTDFNRLSVKWFKYKGINVARKEVRIGFRGRYIHFEKKPWPLNGYVTTYDNAADIEVGVNLAIANRQSKANVAVRDMRADWPSGPLGWVQDAFDGVVGFGNWLAHGKFVRLTDQLASITPALINLTAADKLTYTNLAGKYERLNRNNVIYLDHTEYEQNGVWFVTKVNPAANANDLRELKDLICEIAGC